MAVLVLLLLVRAETVGAQQVSRSIDRDTLRTGDTFTYRVHITGAEDVDEVIYPDSSDFGPDFVIRNKELVTDRHYHTLHYTLQFFGINTRSVPGMYAGLVTDDDTLFLSLPENSFFYESRVEDTEAELRPLKPIFPFLGNRWPLILMILALMLIAGYLLYHYRDRFFPRQNPDKKPGESVEPFHNPVDELHRELKRIEETFSKPERKAKRYYTELTDAIRSYIEQVHGFPALESTTFELVDSMRSNRFDEEVFRLAEQILQEADLVKFARYKPNASACRDVMKNSHMLAGRIAITDRQKIDTLRKKHESEQKEQLSEAYGHDMG